jgi:hypothetical protein
VTARLVVPAAVLALIGLAFKMSSRMPDFEVYIGVVLVLSLRLLPLVVAALVALRLRRVA